MTRYELIILPDYRANLRRDGIDISDEVHEVHIDLVAGERPYIELVLADATVYVKVDGETSDDPATT